MHGVDDEGKEGEEDKEAPTLAKQKGRKAKEQPMERTKKLVKPS